MQKLSVWAVRLSLVYFALGAVLGALLLAAKAVALPPGLWLLRPAHVEALLFGFMVQFVMGVGYWILPRVPAPWGEVLMTAALAFLNAGVWAVALATALRAIFWSICPGYSSLPMSDQTAVKATLKFNQTVWLKLTICVSIPMLMEC